MNDARELGEAQVSLLSSLRVELALYEQLTQGVSAADAGTIADDFAFTMKRTEDSLGLSTTHVAALIPNRPEHRGVSRSVAPNVAAAFTTKQELHMTVTNDKIDILANKAKPDTDQAKPDTDQAIAVSDAVTKKVGDQAKATTEKVSVAIDAAADKARQVATVVTDTAREIAHKARKKLKEARNSVRKLVD